MNCGKKKAEDRLTVSEATRLRDAMKVLRKTLTAELHGFSAYVVTPKRIDVSKLVDDVASLFAPGAYDRLPDIAKYDLREAGRCIAFELPTSAAFHLMRGVEAVLRTLYCKLAKRDRADLLWGPMLTDLATRRIAGPHKDLLSHLDHIRRSFRNPTQHPEKIYDIQEVQDLFSLCVDTINRMAKLI
jgi:hypothetical protein